MRAPVVGVALCGLAAVAFIACDSPDVARPRADVASPPNSNGSVVDAVGPSGTRPDGTLDYVARFASEADARAHAREVEARGGKVQMLDSGGRIARIVGSARSLSSVTLASGSHVTANVKVRLRPQDAPPGTPAPASAAAAADPLDGLLTARTETGVEALVSRFPAADGRFAKVAVFDTGIDFDVDGVSANGKLAGFFDLTDFGKVTPEAASRTASTDDYAFGAHTLRVPDALGATVERGGALDEAALSNASLTPGYDFDKNGKSDDVIVFAAGRNATGAAALWFDVNRNGIAEPQEELTDFNTTHRTIDVRGGAANTRTPVAVTLTEGAVQFHGLASSSNHGTSCASIVAGDGLAGGRINGMAPKAGLVSYLLDPYGQDVYTIDQLIAMFLHAKQQGVDAISISYGFARADLASARFLADLLDAEVASAGIVIGIAAGNEGPALSTAAADDYVPHWGFSVGAAITPGTAQNVYGWSGQTKSGIIHYSSVGPTEGGRPVPDILSPFMNLARGKFGQGVSAFGGTSSATPALIGSVAALMSALKASGETTLDARLVKLAVQNTANPIEGIGKFFQGGGIVNVAAAFDVYKRLAAEVTAAGVDAARKTSVALELRAQTVLDGQSLAGEGIMARSIPSTAQINVTLAGASAALVDLAAAPEPLRIAHESSFFVTPAAALLGARGAQIALQFDAAKLVTPGVYTDTVTVARDSDGVVLLRVPVVVMVSGTTPARGVLASVDGTLEPQDVIRIPVTLTEPSTLRFDGFMQSLGRPGAQSTLVAQIVDIHGQATPLLRSQTTNPFASLKAESPLLPAGAYEVFLVRLASSTSTFARDLKVSGALRRGAATLIAERTTSDGVTFALRALEDFAFDAAAFSIEGRRVETALTRGERDGRTGFLGVLDLGAAVSQDGPLAIAITQDGVDAALERMLAMEVTLSAAASHTVLERGWVVLGGPELVLGGAGTSELAVDHAGGPIEVIAYPNIVNWSRISTTTVKLAVGVPMSEPAAMDATVPQRVLLRASQPFALSVPVTAAKPLPAHAYGTIELTFAGEIVARVPVALP
jgi:hypothetical protein